MEKILKQNKAKSNYVAQGLNNRGNKLGKVEMYETATIEQ